MPISTILLYVALAYTFLTIGLYILSLMLSKAGFVARILASYVCLVVCALYGTAAAVVMRIAGYGHSAQWATARSFKWTMLATTGVTFEVIDPDKTLEKTRPAIFIGNHQTELDVLMLGCIFPKHCCVTAKSSLRKVPALGWFMSLSGTVFIDRKNSKDAREAMRGAADEIRDRKQSVYMFPEGTRSYATEPTLLPFKKGAFYLAVEAQVPIVPVVSAVYSDVLSPKELRFTSGRIPTKVLEPISTIGLTAADVDKLCQDTRQKMLDEITSLTAQFRAGPIARASTKVEKTRVAPEAHVKSG